MVFGNSPNTLDMFTPPFSKTSPFSIILVTPPPPPTLFHFILLNFDLPSPFQVLLLLTAEDFVCNCKILPSLYRFDIP